MNDDRNYPRTAYWRQHLHLLTTAALVPALAGIYYLSFWLRFEGQLSGGELACFRATVGWVLLVKLAWFVGLRACRGWSRSVSFYDLLVLLRAATGGLLTMAMIQYLLAPAPTIPRSVFLLDWGTTIVVLGGARSLVRGVRETRWSLFRSAGEVRVLIAGAGDMGASTLRMIRRIGRPRYRVVGFIGDSPSLVGTRIEGVPVVGVCEHTRQLVQRYGARQILVMQGELAGPQLRRLMDDARRGACEVRVLPNYRPLDRRERDDPAAAGLDRRPAATPAGAVGHRGHPPVDRRAGDPGHRQRRQHRLGNLPPIAAVRPANVWWRSIARRRASSFWNANCSRWPPESRSTSASPTCSTRPACAAS